MERAASTPKELFGSLERLTPHHHLCLLYETPEEQFSAVAPFLHIGLCRGEKCLYITDDNSPARVLEALSAAGIDTAGAVKSGALAVEGPHELYLGKGCFDPDATLDLLREAAESALRSGFTALRLAVEMTWALSGAPGAEKFVAFESGFNMLLSRSCMLAACQYDCRRFSPETLRKVLYTHPFILSRGMVYRNFYYVPPEEFLAPDHPGRAVERLLATMREIEEAEARIERSEEKYRSLIDNIPDVIWTADEQLNPLFVSRNVERIAGYTPEEVCAGGSAFFLEKVHPDDRSLIERSWKDLFSGGTKFDIEFRARRKDGSWMWVRDRAITTYERDGIRCADGVLTDITAWKQASEELREKDRFMKTMLSALPDIIFLKDGESVYRMVNPAFCRFFGKDEAAIVGLTDADLFPAGLAAQYRAEDITIMESGIPIVKDEETNGAQGSCWVQTIKVPIFDATGAVTGIIGAVRNIEKRKKAEADREQLIAELQNALAKIKTLRGLLPICAACKRIRDDQGYWNQIEAFIRDHSEAEFSHGICPDCSRRLYPDFYKKQP